MQQCNSFVNGMSIGMDLGDRHSYLVGVDGKGQAVLDKRVATRERALRKIFEGMEPCRIGLEMGPSAGWVTRLLRGLGHEVWVANPRRVRLIAENPNKSDRADAETLARLVQWDPRMLHPVEPRSEGQERDLETLKARHQLVKVRTGLIGHVRSAVKRTGGRLPSCSSAGFGRRMGPLLPAGLESTLEPLVEQIDSLSAQIKRFDQAVARLCQSRYPATQQLMQVRGVGPLTALAFVLRIEDPLRFAKSRQVGPYLGLAPGRRQSGRHDPQLRISKRGDPFLRRLLVQCAHYILGPFGEDSRLRRFGLRLAERGGKKAKKIALVAVARKLAVLLHKLWISGQPYDPLYEPVQQQAV